MLSYELLYKLAEHNEQKSKETNWNCNRDEKFSNEDIQIFTGLSIEQLIML